MHCLKHCRSTQWKPSWPNGRGATFLESHCSLLVWLTNLATYTTKMPWFKRLSANRCQDPCHTYPASSISSTSGMLWCAYINPLCPQHCVHQDCLHINSACKGSAERSEPLHMRVVCALSGTAFLHVSHVMISHDV